MEMIVRGVLFDLFASDSVPPHTQRMSLLEAMQPCELNHDKSRHEKSQFIAAEIVHE